MFLLMVDDASGTFPEFLPESLPQGVAFLKGSLPKFPTSPSRSTLRLAFQSFLSPPIASASQKAETAFCAVAQNVSIGVIHLEIRAICRLNKKVRWHTPKLELFLVEFAMNLPCLSLKETQGQIALFCARKLKGLPVFHRPPTSLPVPVLLPSLQPAWTSMSRSRRMQM